METSRARGRRKVYCTRVPQWLNMHKNHLRISLKCRFGSSGFGGGWGLRSCIPNKLSGDVMLASGTQLEEQVSSDVEDQLPSGGRCTWGFSSGNNAHVTWAQAGLDLYHTGGMHPPVWATIVAHLVNHLSSRLCLGFAALQWVPRPQQPE